jgi:filamentous hemagglutinin family protein
MNSTNQTNDRYIENEVSYLLDRQDGLMKTLQAYNTKVAVFEEDRNNFFQNLIKTNKIDELKEAVPLFDTVFYVETEKPDFVLVNVTDVSKGLVNIEKEYDIISKEDTFEETISKKLAPETSERIMNGTCLTSKDDIFRTALSGKNKHTVFQLNDNGITLNEQKFININNNGKIEPIVDYTTEIFEMIKQHCLNNETITNIGMRVEVDDVQKRIVYNWA